MAPDSYISAAICLIGLVMNVVTMVVLIQKNMRTPTNLLLGSISVADMITILVYTPKLIVSTAFPLLSKSMEFAYYKLVIMCKSTSNRGNLVEGRQNFSMPRQIESLERDHNASVCPACEFCVFSSSIQ